MRIKQLDIVGFKSFVDKVSLQVPKGMNAIVGPNGCGKSNLFDAIRWVMGETSARNLRGGSMEDVIFKGSETRKPLGMAEVSLTLVNEDGQVPGAYRNCSEIMVTRRLFRSGESEYYINKSRCRRLDIQELFMDSGVGTKSYAIIGQGSIEDILNAKPEERRTLVEEAAGIGKFKSRRKAALRKIESTEQNLKRLEDIIGEIQRQLGSLKRQAGKAKRFRELRDELKTTDICIGRHAYRELEDSVREIRCAENRQENAQQKLFREIRRIEIELESHRSEQAKQDERLEETRQRCFSLFSQRQKLAERLEFTSKDGERIEQEHTRIVRELESLQQRHAESRDKEETLQKLFLVLKNQLTESEKQLSAEEKGLSGLQAEEKEALAALNRHREELYRCLNELARFANQGEESRQRLELVEKRIARCRGDILSNKKISAGLEQKYQETEAALARIIGVEKDLNAMNVSLQSRRTALSRSLAQNDEASTIEREIAAGLRSRIQALVEFEPQKIGEGSSDLDPFLHEFCGMVADFLEAPAELDKALEAVLGKSLQGLVVGKDQDSVALFEAARKVETAQAVFVLPFFSVAKGSFSGGIPLLDLIPGRRKGPCQIGNLLQGVYLVESLDPFLSGRVPRGVTLVTVAGDMLTHRGMLSLAPRKGGGAGVLERKRELRQLQKRYQEVELKLSQLRFNRQTLVDEMAEADQQLFGLDGRIKENFLEQQRIRQTETEQANDKRRTKDRLEVLTLEEQQLEEEKTLLQANLIKAVEGRKAHDSEKVRLEGRLKILQDDLTCLQERLRHVRDEVTILKVELGQLRERLSGTRKLLEDNRKELEESGERSEELEERREEISAESESLVKAREDLQRRLATLVPLTEKEEEQLHSLKTLQQQQGGRIREQEEIFKDLRLQAEKNSGEINHLRLNLQEKELATEHLRRSFLERYQFDIGQSGEAPGEDFDPDKTENRRKELQRLLQGIGDVNLTALEEYRLLDERLEFLNAQKEDLQKSITDLQAAIQKINQTTSRRFADSFAQINNQFRRVLPRLFCGGKGELVLTDEKNLLETGVEIIVQAPGKKLQSLDLLSGGEKTLSAIALIFSTFMIRPSPFCLMDEVDAPLDDANTDRFNGLINELAKDSQFIIITHNKRTMEACDNLYGVTMEESGVSKIVSVRLNDFN